MRPWVRKFLLAAVALTVVAMVVYAFMPQPVPVDLAPVVRGALRVTVDEDGKTRIRERYVVSAPLPGRLRRIGLHPGDIVEAAKSVVATIEPADPLLLDVRSSAEAESRVKASEATLKQTAPMLERSLAELQLARSELQRLRRLAEINAATTKELDDAILIERVRAQELKAASFAQDIAQFELEMAQAALIRTQPQAPGRDSGWRFKIPAPSDGQVLRVFQEDSAVVTAGTPLLEIGDPTDLELEIDVLSSDAVRIKPGAKVWLEHWGGQQPLLGAVRLVEPAAFTKISALGVEEQRVNVIVDFVEHAKHRSDLGDGYRVEARIVTWERPDILKVPVAALFRHRGDWAVFLAHHGRAKLRRVEIGQRNSTEAQVGDGLGEDDQVIVHPSDKVDDGVAVVPRSKGIDRR